MSAIQKKQTGGAQPGVAGDVGTIFANITTLLKSYVGLVTDTITFIEDIYKLPGDIGATFSPSEFGAPGYATS